MHSSSTGSIFSHGYTPGQSSFGVGMKGVYRSGHSEMGGGEYYGSSTLSSENDSTTNLEYLKNIMLSYLNAKTLNEKKSLVPVIAAVLELTPDELTQAHRSLEESAGIAGMGTSFIESFIG